MAHSKTMTAGSEPPGCLVQTVADVMRREPALEAVKIDRGQHSISLATLGRADPELEGLVSRQIRALQSQSPACRLLEGDPSCETCDLSFDPELKKSINIQQEP